MLYGRKENSMLTNCLAACAHLTITVSEIERDIYFKKSSFYHTPLHSMPPVRGFPSEYSHALWYGKARMVSLPDGEKISFYLFWRDLQTWQTDRQTDGRTLHDSKEALMHRTVKIRWGVWPVGELTASVTDTHRQTHTGKFIFCPCIGLDRQKVSAGICN